MLSMDGEIRIAGSEFFVQKIKKQKGGKHMDDIIVISDHEIDLNNLSESDEQALMLCILKIMCQHCLEESEEEVN